MARDGRPAGTYLLQAMIAACHARARRPEETDWAQIAHLYDILAAAAPGPVIEINRAVAHGRAYGPAAGLAILEPLERAGTLGASHLLPSVRGDLLERAGRRAEAAVAFRAAAARTRNTDEQELLKNRADRVEAAGTRPTQE
jgi:predicted RNA polymerase sigma factor